MSFRVDRHVAELPNHYPRVDADGLSETANGRLRFHDGILLRANSKFGNAFGNALTLAGAMGGTIVLSTPATVMLDLPVGVSQSVPDQLAPELKTLWKLGDPPLE